MSSNFATQINDLCINFFKESLPKTGKPVKDKEWTVLSCIIQENVLNETFEIASIGTGTKCIGKDKLKNSGDILNDSHAEVMARRGFIRYLYEQIINANANKNSVFQFNKETKKYFLKSNYKFHFFTTHSPCGDASIFDRNIDHLNSEPTKSKKIKIDLSYNSDELYGCVITNITGAKLFETDTQSKDLMSQDIGKIRIKPGRGVRTLSVSCSDKIAKWNVLGIQGSLPMLILDNPIYIKSFIYGKNTVCNINSTERAIFKRFNNKFNFNSLIFDLNEIVILKADCGLDFEFHKNELNDNLQPCPTSIVWCNVENRPLEIAVSGKKQGVTKSKLNAPSGRLLITKVELFQQFLNILKLFPLLHENNYLNIINFSCKEELVNNHQYFYDDFKKLSKDYNELWKDLKCNYFKIWTEKSEDLLRFSLTY